MADRDSHSLGHHDSITSSCAGQLHVIGWGTWEAGLAPASSCVIKNGDILEIQRGDHLQREELDRAARDGNLHLELVML